MVYVLKFYWGFWKELVIKLGSYEVIYDHNWSNAKRTMIERPEGVKEIIIKWL